MIVQYYVFAFLQCNIKFLCIPVATLGEFFLGYTRYRYSKSNNFALWS
jgi:hypothetical protein